MPQPAEGQVLLRILHFLLDPYMRGCMNEELSFVHPVAVGEVRTLGEAWFHRVYEATKHRPTGNRRDDSCSTVSGAVGALVG